MTLESRQRVTHWYWYGWPSSGGYTTSVCNQPPRPTQPGHPFVGRHS